LRRKSYNRTSDRNRTVRRLARRELDRLLAVAEAADFRGNTRIEIGSQDGRLFGPKVTIERLCTVSDGSSEEEPNRG